MAGIIFGKPRFKIPLMPPIKHDTRCVVQFRPRNSWKGEFGFDWFRLGDTRLDGDTNYETLIGQYYDKNPTDATAVRNSNPNKATAFFSNDPQPERFAVFSKLNALKNLYGMLQYNLGTNREGNAINVTYYKPILALLPREPDPNRPGKFIETGKAEMRILLEYGQENGKEEKPDKVIFEMDNTLMDASHPLVNIDKHTILKKDLDSKIDITITCTASFDRDKEINVWAITLDENGNQTAKLNAGVLRMIAPAKQTVKNIVVVIVGTSVGEGNPAVLDVFKRNLKQAFIKTNVVTDAVKNGIMGLVKINLSNPAHNINNVGFNEICGVDIHANNYKNITRTARLDNLLITTLNRDYPGQFDNHFKLFFLKNSCEGVFDPADGTMISSTAGYSRPNDNINYGIMFSEHNKYTIAHECLHGMGLPHSFFGDNFLYKAQKTDNIMDYSHNSKDLVTGADSIVLDRVATWYWQWRIINNL